MKPRGTRGWICDQYADNEAVNYGKPASWCKEQGVGEGSYYYWLKQLRVESLFSQGGKSQNALVPVFCEVPSALTESSGMALSLRLPGLTLEVSQEADSQSIRMAQAVLSGLC